MRSFTTFIITLTLCFAASWAYVYYVDTNEYVAKESKTVKVLKNPAVETNEIINKELANNQKNPTINNAKVDEILVEETIDQAEEEIINEGDLSDLDTEHNEESIVYLDALEPEEEDELPVEIKDLELYNVNTRETLDITFWADGEYIPTALDELNQFWRDWRKNQNIEVDPQLYVLLNDLHENVNSEAPISLISGYRSKNTNDSLRAMGRNTAKKSQHVLGKAADIYMPDVPVSVVRKKALQMKRGGVGYYPTSQFVHVDTGRVRQWSGK